jgi:hypothetical protein
MTTGTLVVTTSTLMAMTSFNGGGCCGEMKPQPPYLLIHKQCNTTNNYRIWKTTRQATQFVSPMSKMASIRSRSEVYYFYGFRTTITLYNWHLRCVCPESVSCSMSQWLLQDAGNVLVWSLSQDTISVSTDTKGVIFIVTCQYYIQPRMLSRCIQRMCGLYLYPHIQHGILEDVWNTYIICPWYMTCTSSSWAFSVVDTQISERNG